MNNKLVAIISISCLILGCVLGSKYAQKQIVEKEVVVDRVVTQDKIVTVVKTVQAPDGTVTTESTKTEDKKTDQIVTKEASKVTPVGADWRISGGYSPLVPKWTIGVDRHILGNIWLGIMVDTRLEAMGTVSITF